MAWEVTLLQDPSTSRNLPDGDRMRKFVGRKPIRVPEHIAQRCRVINKVQGYDVFKIEEIKDVVTPAPIVESKPVAVATPVITLEPKKITEEKTTVKRIKPLKIRRKRETE